MRRFLLVFAIIFTAQFGVIKAHSVSHVNHKTPKHDIKIVRTENRFLQASRSDFRPSLLQIVQVPPFSKHLPQKIRYISNTSLPIMNSIKMCESRGDYTAQNPHSTASGAYGFLDTTFHNVTGLFGHARDYSAAIQDKAFLTLYDGGAGISAWDASKSCWE